MNAPSIAVFHVVLSAAVLLAVTTNSTRAEDCNNNGIADAQDIVSGTSQDCNSDARPDECGTKVECEPPLGQRFGVSGVSVAVDGDVSIVGSPGESCPSGNLCGAAYVFRFVNGSWAQEAKLTASDTQALDHFGWSVAISQDAAIVGAWQVDCPGGGDDCGTAYVFRYNGVTWLQEAKLMASDAAPNFLCGWSVGIDGNAALVGCRSAACKAGDSCVAAYVFRFDGSNWTEETKLTAGAAAAPNDSFGNSVAIQGSRAIVGARQGGSNNMGAAYIFGYDGSNWTEQTMLNHPSSGDLFGESVSLDGDLIIVGARQRAFVFRHDDSTWNQEANLTVNETYYPYDFFGRDVAIHGNRAVVGMSDAGGSPSETGPGAAFVYEYDGAAWVQVARLSGSVHASFSKFGSAVSMSSHALLVGSPGCAYGGGSPCGAVYSYYANSYAPDCNCNSMADPCEWAGNDCDSNYVPDDCDVAGGGPDDNGNGILDACDLAARAGDDVCWDGTVVTTTPCGLHADCPSTAATCSLKNRYLTIAAPVDFPRSIQVKIRSMNECDVGSCAGRWCVSHSQCPQGECQPSNRIGEIWWAGPETSLANAPGSSLRGAALQCTSNPHSQVWTPGYLHLSGVPIVPAASYEIRSCEPDGTACSNPVFVATSGWGDVAAPFAVVDFTDINNVISKFRVLSNSLYTPRTDLTGMSVLNTPDQPDHAVNFGDIAACVEGFRGVPFRYSVPDCSP